MARIRTIKPAFFRDWDLYQLEQSSGLPVRLAFAGLWTVADREGRFQWKPKELKPEVLPHDVVDFSDVLVTLARGGFISRYEVDGKAYGLVRSWEKHQRIRNDEAVSELPSPPDHSDGFVTDPYRGKERKGTGKERNGESAAEPPDGSTPTPGLRVRADDGEVLLTFPVVGTSGHEWRLRRRQVEEWQRLYPGLDVIAECRHACAWVQANPGRRKTPSGMPRFLTNWFNRTVDRRGVVASNDNGRQSLVAGPDWFEECQRLHAGQCGGSGRHRTRMLIDANKAAAC